MHTGAIVIKEAKEAVPKDIWERSLKNNGTFVGAAYIGDDGKFEISAIGNEADVEMLENYQTEYLDRKIWFFFGKHTSEFSPESQQPFFAVSDTLGEAEVLVFLDGGFENYGEANSAHSDAFFYMQKQLAPHLRSLMMLAGDSSKLFSYLKADPIHEKSYQNQWLTRAAMVLVNRQGEQILWEKGNNARQAEKWGYCSNHYGVAAPAAAAPAPVKATLGSPRKPVIAPESKVAATIAETKPIGAKAPPTVVHAPSEKRETMVITRSEQPPKEFWGERQRVKEWYRLTIPKNKELPERWDSKTNPPAIETRITVDKVDYETKLAEMNKTTSPAAIAAASVAAEEDKKEATAPIRAIAVLPVQQIETIKENFYKKNTVIAKILDENATEITSPKELQAIERQGPTFVEYTGLPNLNATFRWPFEQRVKFCSDYARSAALLTQDLTYALADALCKIEELTGAKTSGIQTPRAAATTTAALPAAKPAGRKVGMG